LLFGFGVGVTTHCPPEDGVLSLSPISISYRHSFPLPGAPKRGGGARKELHHGDMLRRRTCNCRATKPRLPTPGILPSVFSYYHPFVTSHFLFVTYGLIGSRVGKKANRELDVQETRVGEGMDGIIIYSAYSAMQEAREAWHAWAYLAGIELSKNTWPA
jgi:hypothetical protein